MGASFSAPVLVDAGESPEHAPLGRVDLEWLDAETVLVSWLLATGKGVAEIRLRAVGRDGPLGAPHLVAKTRAARASGFPRMVRRGNELVFAWTDSGEPSKVRTAIAGLPPHEVER